MKSTSDTLVLNIKEENHQESSENVFSCKICEKKYKKEHLLAKHLLAHANNEKVKNNTEQVGETEISKRSECKTCGQKFRFFKALQKHEKRHEGSGGFICGTCNIPFTTADAREKHRNREHKVLRCKICNTRFESSEEYLRHINTLHDGRDRELSICAECGKQFKTKGELTHHVSSKCGTIKKYKCNVCFQTLMTAGSLHNHMLRHTGKRTYMCRFCAKTFLTAGQLTVHERIHTQEKAFVCEICNKGFCHRQSLITHSTLHTGIKPYVCENCGNAFSCVGNLLKHRKTHADSCGRSDLRTHRVIYPPTKLKVQINTPPASKIKTLEKRKKLETVENTQNSTTNTWKQENGNHFSEPVQKENENYNNYNYSENNYNEINNFSQNEFQISEMQNMNYKQNVGTEEYIIPDLIPDLPVESSIPLKQEHWLQSEQTQLNTKNFNEQNKNIPEIIETSTKNISPEVSNHSTQENQLKEEQESKHSEEIQSENENQNDDTDWQNFDSDVSEDSVDLNTRKMKLEMKNSKKNDRNSKKKKVKNRDKINVGAEELKKFVEERNFDKSKGMGCKYCNAHYFVPLWLLKHERRHEADETGGPTQKPRPKCSCCSRTFATKEECVTHQQTEHADQLTCKECDKIFANPDSMKAHVNFYHRGVPRKKYTYVCKECGKLFKQKEVLLRHEQNNCGDGPFFQCPVCQKSFTSKHVQRTHMRIHLPDKSLLCKFCGKSFHWKGQLKIHERSHTGEKPFKCQHCPKSFAYRESLITHSTLHSGIKPHLCESCGSRFSCIGNLLKHRRTHAKAFGLSNNQSVKTEPNFIPTT